MIVLVDVFFVTKVMRDQMNRVLLVLIVFQIVRIVKELMIVQDVQLGMNLMKLELIVNLFRPVQIFVRVPR